MKTNTPPDATGLLNAAKDLLETLRWMPKGPQHEGMIKLQEEIAKYEGEPISAELYAANDANAIRTN